MKQQLKEDFEKLINASIEEAEKKEGEQKTKNPNIKTIPMPHISVTPGDKNFSLICAYINAATEDGTMIPIRCRLKKGVFDALEALPQYNATVSIKFTTKSYLSVDIF